MSKGGSFFIQSNDELFPETFTHFSDLPDKLFYLGDNSALSNICVSVVGTRKCSTYGITITKNIVEPLARSGVTIVSGMALGIDTAAHKAALDAHGQTIAVLASGLTDKYIYPKANSHLAQKIRKNGCLISEYEPDVGPRDYQFLHRNRIIAALSDLTIVIEAPYKSGALTTAYAALEYEKEVAAIPHMLTSKNGEGCNDLLKRGAHLIRSAKDIAEILNIELSPKKEPVQSLSPTQQKIIEVLSLQPTEINALSKKVSLPIETLTTELTYLEISQKVVNLGSMTYSVTH